ncbi:MAG: hypothetical protein ACYDEY_09710 [Acidimicrobiales bacterium]
MRIPNKVHKAIARLREERILGVPFTGQKGQAMIIVLGVLMLLALVPLIVFTEASQHLPVSVEKQDAQAALSAAQAGVADFMNNYTHPPAGLPLPYLAYSTPTCTPNPPAPLYYPPNTCANITGQPQGAWTPVPNSGPPTNEEVTYTVHLSQKTGEITLISSGEAGTAPTKIVRTVTVQIQQSTLLNYAYFTNTNAADPQRYNCSPNLLATGQYNFGILKILGQYIGGLMATVLSAIASGLPYVMNVVWGLVYSQFYVDLGGCMPQVFNGSLNLGLPAIPGGANQAAFDLAQFRCNYTAYQQNMLDGSAPLAGNDAKIEGTTMDSILDWITGLVTGTGPENLRWDTADFDGDGGYVGSGYGPDTDDCQVNTFQNVGGVHAYALNPKDISGPIGSNDALYICGNPQFNSVVRLGVPLGGTTQAPNGWKHFKSFPTTVNIPVVGPKNVPHLCPSKDQSGTPTFGPQNPSSQPVLQAPVPFPSTMAPVVNAAPASGNCQYTGPTVFQLNGSTMAVTPLDPNNNSQPNCIGPNVSIPKGGLIYVKSDPNVTPVPSAHYPPQPSSVTVNGTGTGPPGTDLPSGNKWQNNSLASDQCTVNGYTWSNPIQNSVQSEYGASTTGDTCNAGDAIILTSTLQDGQKLTIAAQNNVVVAGNITYTGSNGSGTCIHSPVQSVPWSCTASLGLLARNYVLIDHPVNPVSYQLPPFINNWLDWIANPFGMLLKQLWNQVSVWLSNLSNSLNHLPGWVHTLIMAFINGIVYTLENAIGGIVSYWTSWWTSTIGAVIKVLKIVLSLVPYVNGNTNAMNTTTKDDEFADSGLDEAGVLNPPDGTWENPGNWTMEGDNDNPINGEGGNADQNNGSFAGAENWTITIGSHDDEWLGGETFSLSLPCNWSWGISWCQETFTNWADVGLDVMPADGYMCITGAGCWWMPFPSFEAWQRSTTFTNPLEWVTDAMYGTGDMFTDFFDKVQDGGDGLFDWAAPETPLAPFAAPGGSQGAWASYTPSKQVTEIDAAILAVHHGFMLQNYGSGTGRMLNDCTAGVANWFSQWFSGDTLQMGWSGSLGSLIVNGSIMQNYAEPMGERSPAWTAPLSGCRSGFSSLNYTYDPTLMWNPPPFFNRMLGGGGGPIPLQATTTTETAPAVKPN